MTNSTNKSTNYTEEMLEILFSMYEQLGNEGLDQIAEKLNKPVKSVRSKLVREGKYTPSPKIAIKANGPSKKELLRELESQGFDSTGFEGATKVALSRLLNIVSN
jgi:hypothetical protein